MPDASLSGPYEQLEARFRRIALLGEAEAMLHWDYAAVMPTGGADARSEQLAELKAISHGLLVSAETAGLIDAAKNDAAMLDAWQAANLHEIERRHQRASALDESFVTQLSRTSSTCEQAWRRARAENDFSIVAEPLGMLVDLVREEAQRIGEVFGLDPYDALLDSYEPGGRAADIDPVLDDLAAFLPGFLDDVLTHQAATAPAIMPAGPFPEETQRQLGMKFMDVLGFDFDRGRLDVSHHPFCGGIPDDVRITTRYDESDFTSALMGVLHETGHALYEQGLPKKWRLQPVGSALGMSIHESQSLLMEMQVCRSPEFLEFALPLIRETFNGSGPAWDAANILKLYHKVERSYIRVDADEVTYPLHVIVRYRLEKDIIAGKLAVRDIPDAWNTAFKGLVGIEVENDAQGCLQDIHWYDGALGYFPTYTLGAMTAAQVYQAACAAHPGIPGDIAKGDFSVLLSWLRENIHANGRLLSGPELLRRATGRPLQAAPFKAHMKARYLPA
ncbi:carboxypeptidase M32 [Thalassospiraceae bacterium LMO-JJ14]|nr:carboxypeptidase M32 [Thalassospiraceae bacterium LMO-JJ14]